MHVYAGAPVNLDDLRSQPLTATVLKEATDRIMREITSLLEEIRGDKAPTQPLSREEALGTAKPEENS
jgi:hypothetical protein